MSLQSIRRAIDHVDRQMLRLISRRASLAVRVGQLKRRQARPVFDRGREQEVLRRVTRVNGGPLSAAAVRAIFREILRRSRALESAKIRRRGRRGGRPSR